MRAHVLSQRAIVGKLLVAVVARDGTSFVSRGSMLNLARLIRKGSIAFGALVGSLSLRHDIRWSTRARPEEGQEAHT